MRPAPRSPWWTLAALGALMLAPAPWPGLIAAGLATAAGVRMLVARGLAARRAARALARGGVVLGRDRGARAVVLEDRQLSAHGLVLGASGAGKSTTLTCILTDRIARGMPVVALDVKGSPAFARTLAGAAAGAGRRCVVWTLDGGAHFNPLRHGNPTELKDKLIATERFTEPHYRRAAERYLQTVLTLLARRQGAGPPTLADVVTLCEPRRLAGLVRRLPSPERERLTEYLAGLGPDQLSAVRGLGTRLAIVTESHLGPWLGPGRAGAPELDLRAALRGEMVAVFSLNSSRYGSLAAQIGTMAVQDLVSAAGARLGQAGAPPPPALVAIDEFSALGAEQILALFARGREAGISVLLATQELTDLDRAARGLRDQVLGNTAAKIIHRQDVPASARAVAEMIGTELVWEETRQYGGRGALGPRGSRRPAQRFRIHPDAVATLPTGAAVLITKVPRSGVQVLQVTPAAPQALGPAHPLASPPPVRVGPPAVPARSASPASPRGAAPARRRTSAPRARRTPPPSRRDFRSPGGPERG